MCPTTKHMVWDTWPGSENNMILALSELRTNARPLGRGWAGLECAESAHDACGWAGTKRAGLRWMRGPIGPPGRGLKHAEALLRDAAPKAPRRGLKHKQSRQSLLPHLGVAWPKGTRAGISAQPWARSFRTRAAPSAAWALLEGLQGLYFPWTGGGLTSPDRDLERHNNKAAVRNKGGKGGKR